MWITKVERINIYETSYHVWESTLVPPGSFIFFYFLSNQWRNEGILVLIEVVSVANGLSAANSRTADNTGRRMVLQSSAIHDGGWC